MLGDKVRGSQGLRVQCVPIAREKRGFFLHESTTHQHDNNGIDVFGHVFLGILTFLSTCIPVAVNFVHPLPFLGVIAVISRRYPNSKR